FAVAHVSAPAYVGGVLQVPESQVAGASRCGEKLLYLPTLILTRDAQADASEVARLVLRGEGYCVDPVYGDGSALSVTVRSDLGLGTFGSDAHAPAVLRVRWNAPAPKGHVIVTRSGEAEVARTTEGELETKISAAGDYHVELLRSVPTWYFTRREVAW